VQLAAHTYAFRELPLDRAFAAIAEAGFVAVDVWLGHLAGGLDAADPADYGLRVVALSAGGFYSPDDDAVAHAVEAAEALEAGTLIACAAPELVTWIAERVPRSIRFCVENHWDQPLDRSEVVARVLARARSVAACLDTGHALLAGERPEQFAARLGPALAHVHLKDARSPVFVERLLGRRLRRRLLSRPLPVMPGNGDLDIGRLRNVLARSGFAGAVVAEHEGPDAPAAVARLRQAWEAAGDQPPPSPAAR
jgi:sugar phosphate isomerase/epimerase